MDLDQEKQTLGETLRKLSAKSPAPIITIFVRHAASCKYRGDEFCKRCNCRKHFRWTQNGVQHRRKAGTRSWAEAEDNKRRLEDQLAGRVTTVPVSDGGQPFREAIKAFITEKEIADIDRPQRNRYQTELDRFADFCESSSVFVVQRVTQEMVNAYKATWPGVYGSTYTRRQVQIRLLSFLRFCAYSKWLDRVPRMASIKITEPPTESLTDDEYNAVLAAAPLEFPDELGVKIAVIIQLMRWSGLAVRDASNLRRAEILKRDGFYAIQRKRQKILAAHGADKAAFVYIPIPEEIGELLNSVANGNPEYVFFDAGANKGKDLSHFSKNVSEYISAVFARAKVHSEGHMVSHRLRDTFAVDLLVKGVPLEEVSKLLGHSSVVTTEKHYSRWIKGRQDRLDSLVRATWKKSLD